MPLKSSIFVFCVCCAGSGLGDGLIAHSEEFYPMFVCVCAYVRACVSNFV